LEIPNSPFKYRLASSDIEHKDFAISIATGVSVPTGSYQNGQNSGTLTLLYWVKKDGAIQCAKAIGIQIPLNDTCLNGQQYTSNTVFQYRLGKRLWPELEVNAMGYKGGPLDGTRQTFLTPGLFVGRLPMNRNMGLTFGVGMQIATTSYHTYNRSLLFSLRIPLQSRGVR
jgi:hypothetical protein